MTDIDDLIEAIRAEQDGLERDNLLNAVEDWIAQMRRDLRIADSLADQAAKAIPSEFAPSPSDGGGVDTHHAIKDMAAEIERLRAELAGQRMCVNCGKYAPAGHDRTQPLPECVGPDDMAACTFDLTPSEAWQHWSKIAHDLRADNARLSALVQRAYNEGFSEGMREHTSSRGGKPWMDSRARTAMETSNGK